MLHTGLAVRNLSNGSGYVLTASVKDPSKTLQSRPSQASHSTGDNPFELCHNFCL